MATDGFGLELNGTAPVCEVAFVEFAVVEFVAVEDKFLLHESFIFKDGHYDLTIRRAESASLAGADLPLAALDSSIHRGPQRDCSHIVHAVYDRAGFHYPYASSSDLYVGTHEFQRVTHPQGGDLVVWRGHVGIVVNRTTRLL
jgi:NlpC/P60 family